MSVAEQVQETKKPDFKLRPGLTAAELVRFKEFLRRTGRGRNGGPLVRTLLLKEMDEEDAMRTSRATPS